MPIPYCILVLISLCQSFALKLWMNPDAAPVFFDRLVQPVVLDVWNPIGCGIAFEESSAQKLLQGRNITLRYQERFNKEVLFRTLDYTRTHVGHLQRKRYVWFVICSPRHVPLVVPFMSFMTGIYTKANLVLNAPFRFRSTLPHRLYCGMILLTYDCATNVHTVRVPPREPPDGRCGTWHFFDLHGNTGVTSRNRFPWYSYPTPSLKNAVIQSLCPKNCMTYENLYLIAAHFNATVTKCGLFCDYELHSPVTAHAFVFYSVRIPLNHYARNSLGFLVPRRIPQPKSHYIIRPLNSDAWLGLFLSAFAFSFCLWLLLKMNRFLATGREQISAWSLIEYVVVCWFAPIENPARTSLLGFLLVAWAVLMQVPSNGFRGLLTSYFNEAPRQTSISSLSELLSSVKANQKVPVVCSENRTFKEIFVVAYDIKVSFRKYAAYDLHRSESMVREGVTMESARENLLSKFRTRECNEFVRNGTGFFYGLEDHITESVKSDLGESFPFKLIRLFYLQEIATTDIRSELKATLSTAFLRFLESDIEPHLQRIKTLAQKQRTNVSSPSGFTQLAIQDIWPFIQIWCIGIAISCIIFFLEFLQLY